MDAGQKMAGSESDPRASDVLQDDLRRRVSTARLLVVGAGGIGCELLKNLVLTGFCYIDVIDLDTIDVSNLNRQFLFQKKHVGKSKAEVAKESCLRFNPDAHITAHYDSVFSSKYSLDFFKQFDLVLNALDNKAARSHVNRMCLAADIPLIESGSAGYLGQVTVIKKGESECYECQPKPRQKTFPGCTIRNTPSEPIHCIVWAKHLFNQLFGEADPDMDVSPDTEDPEAAGDAGTDALKKSGSGLSIERVTTRSWAETHNYNPVKLFTKLFHDDIKYLLSMGKLWEERRKPKPLTWSDLPQEDTQEGGGLLKDQRVWSVRECGGVFTMCVDNLRAQKTGGELVWDKDDDICLDFVTAAADLRAHIFGIPLKSRFDIKSMAGNIIPAIATTNAVIAGLIVIEALKLLDDRLEDCKTTYLNRQPVARNRLLSTCKLIPPNPKCYVCAPKPEVSVYLDTSTFTVGQLETKLLKERLGMVAPDVEIQDGKGTIIISSEEGETEENAPKSLATFGIGNGTRLQADDFCQNYQIVLILHTTDELPEGVDFELEVDAPGPLPEGGEKENSKEEKPVDPDDEDEVLVIEGDAEPVVQDTRKRKAPLDQSEASSSGSPEAKKQKSQNDDDIVVLW